jgi:hypothetical protein
MSTHTDPDHLRRRARSLSAFAGQLEALRAMRLQNFAGPDTWHTPRADLCRHLLGANQAQVRAAIDELRQGAVQLERRAMEAELARIRMEQLP